ncbi:MAG: MarR family transcriptional regulator [Clostridia bacterium]|jgi:DNA-binding MarR family transcriptional regulator|nr:MarR family transcriptional regulator [Clostridia bacterium]
MKLSWFGKYRDLVEALICFANNYSSVQNKEFLGEEIKVSFSQIQVVEYLIENEEYNQNMSEVARRLGITSSSFTKLANKLVKKQFLQKFHIQGNQKDIIMQVTPLGKKVYQDYTEQVATKIFKEMFKLGEELSDEDLELFTKMLRSLSSEVGWKDKETVVLVAIDK